MRYLLLILLTTFGLHAANNELMVAAKALDVKKIEELIQKGALTQLEPLEIVAITQALQPFIKKHTLSINRACAAGKLIVGLALFIPASRCVYKAFTAHENQWKAMSNEDMGEWHNISRYDALCDSIKKFLKPYQTFISRFVKGDIGGKVYLKGLVEPREVSTVEEKIFHLPVIATSGFCLAAGGYLIVSGLKQAIEISNSAKALHIMNMLKVELKRLADERVAR